MCKMELILKPLSINDGNDVYLMLQRIGENENEFKNTAYGLTKAEFVEWLKTQYQWSLGEELPDGYVPQTIYWLYCDNIPVGIGKIRHSLNENSREIGGNLGYAIDPIHRGKGYASVLLSFLVEEAKKLNVSECLLTVEKYNPASKRVIEKCGGIIIKESKERWYFSI